MLTENSETEQKILKRSNTKTEIHNILCLVKSSGFCFMPNARMLECYLAGGSKIYKQIQTCISLNV